MISESVKDAVDLNNYKSIRLHIQKMTRHGGPFGLLLHRKLGLDPVDVVAAQIKATPIGPGFVKHLNRPFAIDSGFGTLL